MPHWKMYTVYYRINDLSFNNEMIKYFRANKSDI